MRLLLFFLITSMSVSAQLKGTITDIDNNPIPYVNIYIENSYEGTTSNENGDYVLDTDLSNNLIYKEYINAAYSQFGSKLNKFSFLMGLRMESSRITINQVTTGDLEKKNYVGLFPTVNLSYEISENQSEIFISPRPKQEFYNMQDDFFQRKNLINNKETQIEINNLRNIDI